MSRARTAAAVATAAVLLVVTAGAAHAQQDGDRAADGLLWLTGGVGLGSEGAAAVASLDVAWNEHLFSLRTAHTSSVIGYSQRYHDVGLLYGRAVRWSEGVAALSAGPGVARGDVEGVQPSLSIAARTAWHFSPALGIGGYVFMNFNRDQPFGGAALTLELGVLR